MIQTTQTSLISLQTSFVNFMVYLKCHSHVSGLTVNAAAVWGGTSGMHMTEKMKDRRMCTCAFSASCAQKLDCRR